MNQDSSRQDNKVWYRHFWVWFVILLPASSVVAGITTLVIAINNADDPVADNWYKDGRGINKSLAEEKRADELDLNPTLTNESGRAVLRFHEGAAVSAASLKLALRHPTRAERDQVLRLVRDASGQYRAPVTLPRGRWVATLEPEPGDWRIRRRLELDDDGRVTLQAKPW